ncbi:hypothetical protein CKO25_13555 [Thiocapsa imhoffii]|uniref:Uncharacterized protein n=1 Tax=Thiocapsa imhoffii TaxID=382777 RepID=A0A9X0WJV4_9GAMM|nr:hypothetical protein [Thiocapsa imhoffii]MBK1645654.1 hypothetical protein [Thiocapsa imhoffii]
MKTTILALIFLLIGSAVGGFLALGFGAGMGAASGLVVGSQAGVCLAIETVEEQGFVVDPAQIDALIATAVGKIREQSGAVPAEAGLDWISNAAQCRDIIRKLMEGPETVAQSAAAPRAAD